MGTWRTIGVYSEAGDAAAEFAKLLCRLSSVCSDCQLQIRKNTSGLDSAVDVPILGWTTPDVEMQVADLASDIATSADALTFVGIYKLPADRKIGVHVRLVGKRYNSGYSFRTDGPVQVHLDYRQLVPSEVRSLPRKPHRFKRFSAPLFRDQEALFGIILGVNSPHSPARISHGSMWPECGWASPVGCSMVFHRDPGELVKDLARTFIEFRSDTYVIETFKPGFDFEPELRLASERDPIEHLEPVMHFLYDLL